MPSPGSVERFMAQVVSGDHVGAIRDWYADDASMQENQAEPRRGREGLIAREAATLARMARVDTEALGPPLISGDLVAIRWRFTFTPKSGAPSSLEELAWQRWAGERIVEETFVYDPAQLAR